jgi:hypothetical protein
VHSPLMMQVAGTGEAPYVAPSRKITLGSSPFVSMTLCSSSRFTAVSETPAQECS